MYLLNVEFSSFLNICPGVGLLDHRVALFLVFKGTSILFSIAATPIYIPTNLRLGFPGGTRKKPPANTGDMRVRSLGRKIPWRRAWQPSPLSLPGESHGQRSLVGYSPWGRKESDTTAQLSRHAYKLTVTREERDGGRHKLGVLD